MNLKKQLKNFKNMKIDSRLYFINDPYLYIPLLLCLALLGFVFKQEQPKAKVKQKESVTSVKTDTIWKQ